MPILDTVSPQQTVACDLCGITFTRRVENQANSFLSGTPWEDVSIVLYPHLEKGKFGLSERIEVEYACLDCRRKFAEEMRKLIERMQTGNRAR